MSDRLKVQQEEEEEGTELEIITSPDEIFPGW
jgi:hypothetical protein